MSRAKCSRRERGASAIEFAIVFPLFFGLIYIMVSYGLLFSLQHSITEAGPLLTVGQKNSVLTAVTN